MSGEGGAFGVELRVNLFSVAELEVDTFYPSIARPRDENMCRILRASLHMVLLDEVLLAIWGLSL
jgi:hypothetical protein